MEFLSKDSRTLQTNESGGNKLVLRRQVKTGATL